MSGSILKEVKKAIGMAEDYTHFDVDLIMHINSALFVLSQLGVGPSEGVKIQDATDTWDLIITPGKNLEAVKTVVFLRTKLNFDPPSSAWRKDSMNEMIKEYEWRLNVQAEGSES